MICVRGGYFLVRAFSFLGTGWFDFLRARIILVASALVVFILSFLGMMSFPSLVRKRMTW